MKPPKSLEPKEIDLSVDSKLPPQVFKNAIIQKSTEQMNTDLKSLQSKIFDLESKLSITQTTYCGTQYEEVTKPKLAEVIA